MDLNAWISDHMGMLVGIPLLLLMVLVPLLFANRGQGESRQQKSTAADPIYVPGTSDASDSPGTD